MFNIPSTDKKRVVIVGCGFGGLRLARKLQSSEFQVVIIDKNNYHQFQPLMYQVATSGLEPSAISFPLRKIFQNKKDFYIRKTEVKEIKPESNLVVTAIGELKYDYLVLAHGTKPAFFGMKSIEHNAKPMKSVMDAIDIRNSILQNFEEALNVQHLQEKEGCMNIVIVGGGPSGVEIAGALAEMCKYIIPKDYPEIDYSKINIYLVEAMDRLLTSMSVKASEKAKIFLEKHKIKVLTNTSVKEYDQEYVYLNDDHRIRTNLVLWTAGIMANRIEGFKPENFTKNNFIKVDCYNKVIGYDNIFAIGDVAFLCNSKYEKGHPQVAQVAIQQAKKLSENLMSINKNKPMKPFSYRNLGSMATIGRNQAVVEFPFFHFYGVFAWFVWMAVHLMAIVGVKNRLMIFINWAWKYFTYDQSLRLIFKHKNVSPEI